MRQLFRFGKSAFSGFSRVTWSLNQKHSENAQEVHGFKQRRKALWGMHDREGPDFKSGRNEIIATRALAPEVQGHVEPRPQRLKPESSRLFLARLQVVPSRLSTSS